MTMVPSSDSFSDISSGSTNTMPINYSPYGCIPTPLQQEPTNSVRNSSFWLIFLLIPLFWNCTSIAIPHKFALQLVQTPPIYFDSSCPLPLPFSTMNRASRRTINTPKGHVATPSPPAEKQKHRDDNGDDSPPLTEKKAKTSAFQVMDVDPHANPKESALKIPLPATKYKF